MTRAQRRWLAELIPTPGTGVEGLLALPAGLDVWEHRANTLVVAAEAAQLEDLERRRVATVVWLRPVDEFIGQPTANQESTEEPETEKGEE
jgi:hypothetical protein